MFFGLRGPGIRGMRMRFCVRPERPYFGATGQFSPSVRQNGQAFPHRRRRYRLLQIRYNGPVPPAENKYVTVGFTLAIQSDLPAIDSVNFETTVDRPVEASGVGLHSGVPVSIRIVPAPAATGIVFRRTDLDGFAIPASWRYVARVS